MPIGMYDPDEEESGTVKRAKLSKLQEEALRACGRKYFKNPQEKKRFRALEDKCRGATPDEIMFEAWLRHNMNLAVIHNKKIITRTFAWLMSACENDERRVDWTVANREKVLKERASSLDNLIFGE